MHRLRLLLLFSLFLHFFATISAFNAPKPMNSRRAVLFCPLPLILCTIPRRASAKVTLNPLQTISSSNHSPQVIANDIYSVTLPEDFYALQQKKDIGVLLKAGNIGTTSVVAVERFKTFTLLQNEGVIDGSKQLLSNWSDFGDNQKRTCEAVIRYRDRDKIQSRGGATDEKIVDDSIRLDESLLTFVTTRGVPVQDAEKYMELTGRSSISRTTIYELFLGEGVITAIYGSWGDVEGEEEVIGNVVRSFSLTK